MTACNAQLHGITCARTDNHDGRRLFQHHCNEDDTVRWTDHGGGATPHREPEQYRATIDIGWTRVKNPEGQDVAVYSVLRHPNALDAAKAEADNLNGMSIDYQGMWLTSEDELDDENEQLKFDLKNMTQERDQLIAELAGRCRAAADAYRYRNVLERIEAGEGPPERGWSTATYWRSLARQALGLDVPADAREALEGDEQ